MIFTEFRFLLFFLVAFSVHWSLRGFRARKIWLLLCSNVFYAAWDWRFLFLLWTSILIDYSVGSWLGRTDDPRVRKWLITASLVANFGGLAFFKYTNFFIESGVEFSHWLGLDVSQRTLDIVLPVGISFYTFQSLSYTIDVYRRELQPVKSLLDLALFITFFTHLVAGPIVRAKYFLPQVFTPRSWANVRVRPYLTLFLVGFVKKACISDNVVTLVDAYFKDPKSYDALGAWTAVLLYAVQIYCDFSGYTDMAIATAGLIGYELQLNFNFPYLASDIREFWRRWHMSLSTWLRDYLYISLGGNRGSRWFQYRNLMLTMLLGGLWHGAGWNFVIWGGLHGFALVAHREWERVSGRRLPTVLSMPLTFWWVCLAWIFFRAQTFSGAMVTVRSFVAFDNPGAQSWGWAPLAVFGALIAAHLVGSTHAIARASERWPNWLYALAYGATFAIVLAFMNGAVQPFIYFQF